MSDTKRLVLDLDGRNGTATDGTTGRLEAPATPGSCLCWSSHNTPKGHSPRTIISVSAQPVGVPPASLDTLAPLWTEPCRGARGVWSHPLEDNPWSLGDQSAGSLTCTSAHSTRHLPPTGQGEHGPRPPHGTTSCRPGEAALKHHVVPSLHRETSLRFGTDTN